MFEHIKMQATRLKERPGTDFKDAIHWSLVLNGIVTVEYSEGIGHFVNSRYRLANKMVAKPYIDAVKAGKEYRTGSHGLTVKECGELFTKRVNPSNGKVSPPDIKDVLYSLTMDADAINYDFEEWCSNYGYDTDSRKALATYQECRDSYVKLKSLGLKLEELQEYFQDY